MQTISRRLFAGAIAVTMSLAPLAYGQGGRYSNARGLVARVQNNLRRAERSTEPTAKEKERYFNAQHHLSEFDRELAKDKFDKDKLDEAIDDVKNIVENNTLSPEDRDILTADLRDLRELRRTRGEAC